MRRFLRLLLILALSATAFYGCSGSGGSGSGTTPQAGDLFVIPENQLATEEDRSIRLTKFAVFKVLEVDGDRIYYHAYSNRYQKKPEKVDPKTLLDATTQQLMRLPPPRQDNEDPNLYWGYACYGGMLRQGFNALEGRTPIGQKPPTEVELSQIKVVKALAAENPKNPDTRFILTDKEQKNP